LLTAFIDESGHSAEAKVIALAGFAAVKDQWDGFESVWNEVLNGHGAPYLHMREYAHRRGPFSGWSEDRRRSLMAGMLDGIAEHRLIAIGAAIDVEGFHALSPEVQKGLIDPFFCCMQEVAYGLAVVGHTRGSSSAVFSQQDEFAPTAERLWNHLRERVGFEPGLDEISFEDMRSSPGLQAADLLVYELRHFYNRRRSEPKSTPRWPFKHIVMDQRSRGHQLLKFLPSWYLELQASGEFEQEMARRVSDAEGLTGLTRELWPQLDGEGDDSGVGGSA
jgi:hypothetical protein